MNLYIATLPVSNSLAIKWLKLIQLFFSVHWRVTLMTSLILAICCIWNYQCRKPWPISLSKQKPPPKGDEKREADFVESKCWIGKQVWYLIKRKGSQSRQSSWQRKQDIHPVLVASFEARLRKGRRHYQIIEPTNWDVDSLAKTLPLRLSGLLSKLHDCRWTCDMVKFYSLRPISHR